jgi:hypothetical protein
VRKEIGTTSVGLWVALGCKHERGREAGLAARPRLGHAGVGETEVAGRAGLGFQLSFGPHSQNKFENSFSFSKSFYNLQTNFNSIQI